MRDVVHSLDGKAGPAELGPGKAWVADRQGWIALRLLPRCPAAPHDGVTSCSRWWWWKSGGAGRWSPGHLVNCHLVGCLAKTAVRLLLATLSQLQAEVDGRAPPAEKTAAKYISRAASRADSWFTSFHTSLLKYFPSPGQWVVRCGVWYVGRC